MDAGRACSIALPLAAGALAVGLTGACGGTPQQEIETAFERAASAFRQADADKLCRSLSPEGRLLVGTAAHGKRPVDCPRDIRKFLATTKPYRVPAQPQVIGTSETGDGRATAEIRVGRRTVVTLPFSDEHGSWKLDGLYDAGLSALQAIGEPEARGLVVDPAPKPADSGDVTVQDRRARPCPDVAMDAEDYPIVSGGCVLELSPSEVSMSVWSPFGVIPYGDCELSFDLHLDSSGRAWVADFLVGGRQPCVDTVPCVATGHRTIPWAASIEPAGDGLRLRVDDVCLDTCMGRFEGRWDIAMSAAPRGWRLRFDSMLGTSGWRTVGTVASHDDPIDIE